MKTKEQVYQIMLDEARGLLDYPSYFLKMEKADLWTRLYNTTESFIWDRECREFCENFNHSRFFKGVFGAIEAVKQYENEQGLESATDLTDPCKLANMLVLVMAEELLTQAPEMPGETVTAEYLTKLINWMEAEQKKHV